MMGVTPWPTECLSSRQQEVDKGYQTGADMIIPGFIPTLRAFSLTLSDGHRLCLHMGLQKGYGEMMRILPLENGTITGDGIFLDSPSEDTFNTAFISSQTPIFTAFSKIPFCFVGGNKSLFYSQAQETGSVTHFGGAREMPQGGQRAESRSAGEQKPLFGYLNSLRDLAATLRINAPKRQSQLIWRLI